MSFLQLAELYARRAREFSEAVALLGGYREAGPEVLALMREIRWRRSLCFEVAERFERYMRESKPMATPKLRIKDHRNRYGALVAIMDGVNPARVDVEELQSFAPDCSDLPIDELACEVVQRAVKRRIAGVGK